MKKRTPQQKYNTYCEYVRICIPIKNKISLIKKIVGITCLIIAIFPNGLGFIFYPLGFSILVITKKDLKKYYLRAKHTVKYYYRRFKQYGL